MKCWIQLNLGFYRHSNIGKYFCFSTQTILANWRENFLSHSSKCLYQVGHKIHWKAHFLDLGILSYLFCRIQIKFFKIIFGKNVSFYPVNGSDPNRGFIIYGGEVRQASHHYQSGGWGINIQHPSLIIINKHTV